MVYKINKKIKDLCLLISFFILCIILNWDIFKNLFPKKYNNIIYKKSTKSIEPKKSSDSVFIKNSREYWEKRYANGGNSGVGSYNYLAEFKAEILNNFVTKNNINTVIEWGSGDCNQLSLANYKNYIGYDVSQTAIRICSKKFENDSTKKFFHLDNNFVNDKKADLSISLDVIYHLIEDDVFDLYMNNLFSSSNKFVCIYSTNNNSGGEQHVKHRKFTDWIDIHMSKNWKLKEFIPNKYRISRKKREITSQADFYFYEKNERKSHFYFF